MSGQEQDMEEATPLGGNWSRERVTLVASVFLVYALYYPVTHYAIDLTPIDMSTWVDRTLPLSPLWILIYAMIYPATITPLFVVTRPLLFRQTAFAFFISALIGLVCFVLFPVHMTLRPSLEAVTGGGFLNWGVQLCYAVDQPSGCFPSLHVTYATIAALECARGGRSLGRVMWVVAILIDLSTLLVKQHFLADVIAGSALAFGSVWLSRAGLISWLSQADGTRGEPSDLRPLLYPSVFFALIVGGLYLCYLMGVEPRSLAH